MKNKKSRKAQSFFKKIISSREKPYQPTNDKFSIRDWQDEFWSIDKPDIRDFRLFESGIWFYECFREIINKFEAILRYKDTKDKLIRLQVGAVNHLVDREYNNFQEINRKSLEASDLFDFLSSSEAVVELVRHALIKIYKDENTVCNNITLTDWLERSINLSLMYDELKHFWMQCLWHEWYIKSNEQSKEYLITTDNFEKSNKRRRALSWRDGVNQQKILEAIEDWQNMPIEEKYQFLELPILKIEDIDDNHIVKLGISNRHTIEDIFPLEKIILGITLDNICYRELLEKPCPNFKGLTLFQILLYWQFISPLSAQAINHLSLSEKSLGKEALLKASPTFKRSELLKLTLEIFPFTEEQANTIINLLTFEGEYSDDLWCQPLIKIDEDNFTFINCSLKTPNLFRCLGVWLEKTGWKKENLDNSNLGHKLGKLFESYVRSELKKANKLESLKIYDYPIYLEKNAKDPKDTDLIMNIGDKIIIGEIKYNIKYPTEPIEYDKMFQNLVKAGEQLNKRKQYIEKNIHSILKQLKLTHVDIENVKLIPVIISNLSVAAGHNFHGFPVVDLSILKTYISNNTIRICDFTLSQDNKLNRELKKEILLYSSEQEAEDRIEEYIENPPQLSEISKDTKWQKILLPLILSTKKVVAIKPTVEKPYLNFSINS